MKTGTLVYARKKVGQFSWITVNGVLSEIDNVNKKGKIGNDWFNLKQIKTK